MARNTKSVYSPPTTFWGGLFPLFFFFNSRSILKDFFFLSKELTLEPSSSTRPLAFSQ